MYVQRYLCALCKNMQERAWPYKHIYVTMYICMYVCVYVCMQDAIFGRFGLIRGNNLSHAVLPHNYPNPKGGSTTDRHATRRGRRQGRSRPSSRRPSRPPDALSRPMAASRAESLP